MQNLSNQNYQNDNQATEKQNQTPLIMLFILRQNQAKVVSRRKKKKKEH